MTDVVCVSSRTMYRRFLLFSPEKCVAGRFFRADALRRQIDRPPARDEDALTQKYVLFMAVNGRRDASRIMTGVDANGNGYFSLFDAIPDKQSVGNMLDSVLEWQRRNGGTRLIGPISPHVLDLEPGILKSGFEETPAFGDRFNPPYYGEYLEQYGFEVESERLAYRIRMEEFDGERYRIAAERIAYRKRLKTLDLASSPQMMAQALYEIMEGELPGQVASIKIIEQLYPFLANGMCPAVFDLDTGEAVGILIAVSDWRRGKPVRIVNLWVREKWRGRGTVVMLLDAFMREARRRNLMEVDASFVESENLSSQMMLERLRGRVIHRYCRYLIYI